MFGPKTPEEACIYAQENFRISVQQSIHNQMVANGLDIRSFARKLGVTEKSARRYFEDGYEMSVRTVARICHILGFKPVLTMEKNDVG